MRRCSVVPALRAARQHHHRTEESPRHRDDHVVGNEARAQRGECRATRRTSSSDCVAHSGPTSRAARARRRAAIDAIERRQQTRRRRRRRTRRVALRTADDAKLERLSASRPNAGDCRDGAVTCTRPKRDERRSEDRWNDPRHPVERQLSADEHDEYRDDRRPPHERANLGPRSTDQPAGCCRDAENERQRAGSRCKRFRSPGRSLTPSTDCRPGLSSAFYFPSARRRLTADVICSRSSAESGRSDSSSNAATAAAREPLKNVPSKCRTADRCATLRGVVGK